METDLLSSSTALTVLPPPRKVDFVPKPPLIRVAVESPSFGADILFTESKGFKSFILSPRSSAPFPEADLVVFTGGADISPNLYKQKPLPCTYPAPSRDEFGQALHRHYAHLPKIGICRGAQLLCGLNGGSLWQDIPDHENCNHQITILKNKRNWFVNSLHHQACRLTKEMVLLAESVTPVTFAEDDKVIDTTGVKIPEAFFIPEDNALCVQFHPEYSHTPSREYFTEIFWEHFGSQFRKAT